MTRVNRRYSSLPLQLCFQFKRAIATKYKVPCALPELNFNAVEWRAGRDHRKGGE